MKSVIHKIIKLFSVIIILTSMIETVGASEPLSILFIGDSLTAGYGIDQEESYPAIVQTLAEDQGLSIKVINGGMSGDTSAGGLRRLPWLLKNRIDVAVLALGANDGLRGLPVEELERNLTAIVKKIKEQYPDATVILAGMKLPLNFGPEYTEKFEGVFGSVAVKLQLPMIPFLLDGVAGVPSLNQNDRLHPTELGHRKMAENVWQLLAPVLSQISANLNRTQ